jgi:hypothetical protein
MHRARRDVQIASPADRPDEISAPDINQSAEFVAPNFSGWFVDSELTRGGAINTRSGSAVDHSSSLVPGFSCTRRKLYEVSTIASSKPVTVENNMRNSGHKKHSAAHKRPFSPPDYKRQCELSSVNIDRRSASEGCTDEEARSWRVRAALIGVAAQDTKGLSAWRDRGCGTQ